MSAERSGDSSALRKSLSGLRLMRQTFTLRARDTVTLGPDEMKGDKWRGWLGQALAASHNKELYRSFFGREEKAPPRPYVLRPALDSMSFYAPGESFVVDMIFIGAAIDSFGDIIGLFENSGELGIGTYKGRFEVLRGSYEHIDTNHLINAESETDEVVLEMLTPLKLKIEKKLYYNETPFEVFIKLLIKRLVNLNNIYGNVGTTEREEIKQAMQYLIGKTADVKPRSHTDWAEFQRYSSRQQGWQKMGGQMGLLAAKGDLSLLYPFLKLGEIVGVGSDTTIGFGRYKVLEVFSKG